MLAQANAALSEARKAVEASMAARDSALAQYNLAGTTYKRFEGLRKEKSVSRQEFDEIKAKNEQAKAALNQAESVLEANKKRVEQAKASVKYAEASNKDAFIAAPYDGIISSKMIEEGDLVMPGSQCFILEKKQGFRIDVEIPETFVNEIKLNQKIEVLIPFGKENIVDGIVETISPSDRKSVV